MGKGPQAIVSVPEPPVLYGWFWVQVLYQVLPSALMKSLKCLYIVDTTPVDRWKTESKEYIQALKVVGSDGDGNSPWSTLV